MAAWSESVPAIIGAMENAIVPNTTAALKDKVFHANIQIESVEDAPRRDISASHPQQIENHAIVAEDAAFDERAAEMQMWWDESIRRNMNLPDGYSKVAVLLIKWADELDELRTKAEVRLYPK